MPVLAFEDARIDSCDLQLGDTWRGMQGKMSVTTPVKKIRKKSENKPQSQINKCHNEKRRRELENETINQLEELLGTCLAEVKQPDKNGIVREATRQIQEVLNRRRECPNECPLRVVQCLSPLQGGEVSSTQSQPPPPGQHYSEITTLIEALKHYTASLGWILLEINPKGEIECVTDNIKDLILLDRTELYKKSIFSLLHVRDHAKLRPLLKNIQSFGWASGDGDKFQAIQARLLVDDSDGTNDAEYVEAVIHAAPVRGSSSEQAGSVMCVIRRCEDASAALISAPLPDGGPPALVPIPTDLIVFRLDCNLNVITCDFSGIESLAGTRYLDLVDSGDRVRIAAHLKGARASPVPPSVSDPFVLNIANKSIRVIAQTRLFHAESSTDHDFIMSTHTVVGDDDGPLEAGAAAPSVGGPLMPSVANGAALEPRYRPAMSPSDIMGINDFDLDPWTVSSFPMPLGSPSGDESKETKDTASEGPPTPLTPQTPATPAEGPSGAAASSGPPVEETHHLRNRLIRPKSADVATTNSTNLILKGLLKQDDEDGTGSEVSAPHTPLTPHTPHTPAALSPLHSAQGHPRPPPPHPSHSQHSQHSQHSPMPQHTQHSPMPQHSQHSQHAQHAQHSQHSLSSSAQRSSQPIHHNNSEMLLRILNDKSDEDGDENRSSEGRRSVPCALLTLLSTNNGPSNNGRTQDSERDSYLERINAAAAGVKRKFEEQKGSSSGAKRATPETQQVSSSAVPTPSSTCSSATSPATSGAGMSPLCMKNQILVSLLARQQTTPTTPLPLPNPILRAYGPTARPRAPQPPPQQQQSRPHLATLANMLAPQSRPSNMNGGVVSTASSVECSTSNMQCVPSHLQMVLQSGSRGGYQTTAPTPGPPPSPLHYANTAPHHVYNNQPQSGSSRQGGDSEVPSDKTLSDILDEVIENMPDADRTAPDVSVLLDLESCQLKPDFVGCKEKTAVINAITQSLMQCETVTKSPVSSSPGPPPVYSVQNIGNVNMSSGSGSGGPLYSLSARESPADSARARAVVEQQRARLLQLQRSQQMLVSREAAEQPQPDLGSTISALVSATPPNVALTRTDYHHLYHTSNPMGANYGTNKITSTQQNPMLSRQLSGTGGGGYAHGSNMAAHSAAALHTPLSQQPPYHRAPRPQLGGYYEETGAGYCGEFAPRRAPLPPHPSHHAPHAPHASHAPHAPHASHAPHAPHAGLAPHAPHDQLLACAGNGGVSGVSGGPGGGGGAGGAGGTSEYVRNELRAVVGARTARPEMHQLNQELDPLMTFDMTAPSEYYGGGLGGGGIGGGR